jgi:hypothetical protein
MKAYSEDLLKELECPLCCEYMLPPVARCINGHCMCCNCRGKLKNSPLCRDHFSEARCLLAENFVRKIKFRCRYEGCESSLHFHSVKSYGAHLHPQSGQDACGRAMCRALRDIFGKCIIYVLKIETQ